MRTSLYWFLILVLSGGMLPLLSMGQDASPVKPPVFSSGVVNAVYSWDAMMPDTNTADIVVGSAVYQFRRISQYIDGLGRPLERVVKQGSQITGLSAVDLVTAFAYDSISRVPRSYLPFAANSDAGNTSISDGGFKTTAFDEQRYFFSDTNVYSPVFGQAETFYYGKTEYERSFLNRPLRSYAPGNSWVSGSGKGMSYGYWANRLGDSVRVWTVTNGSPGSFGTYTTASLYAAGELTKLVTTDENGKQTIEFKDREGKVILKKVQLTATADNGSGSGYTGWLSTYYVYDSLNLLRCVIQPATVGGLPGASWTLSATMLAEGCFRYEYDGRRRPIVKKVPGAAEVDMVYDFKDRLVLTQDGNLQAAKQYLYTQYDTLNRVVATGLLTDPTNYNNPNYHRGLAAGSTSYPNLGGYTSVEMTRTFYDDYASMAGYGCPLDSNRVTTNDGYLQTASNTAYPYIQTVAKSSAAGGLVTGTRVRLLDSSAYLYTVCIYDEYHRVLQVKSTNITGGTDVQSTQYAFSGLPVMTIGSWQKSGTNAQTGTVLTLMSYDSLGRVIKVQKRIANSLVAGGAMPSGWSTISQCKYDALGRLFQKNLGDKPGATSGTPLANQAYVYNIRGWLLSINKGYVTASTNSDQYFGMELGYDKNASLGTFTPQYNGNIAGVVWKGESDQAKRKYDFIYDAVNRLTGASFNQYVSGSGTSAVFDKSAGIDYSVSGLNYDANGNILFMQQKGWKLMSSSTIDSLNYTYQTGSNKLAKVSDGVTDTTVQLGDFRNGTNTGDDYGYDSNGNLVLDNNKGIDRIRYSYLNLVDTIHSTKGLLLFFYDAAGNKLQKTVYDSTFSPVRRTATLYVGGMVLVNDSLQFVGTEEGRARVVLAGTGFAYDYFMRDHLGNTRVVLTTEGQTDAYPVASLEDGTIPTERLYYGGLDSGRVNKSTVAGYPNDTYTNPNNYIQQLSGASGAKKVGANIVLKVMAGDTINIRANSWYRLNGATPGTPNSVLSSLILGLAGGISGTDAGHFFSSPLQQTGVLDPGLTSFLSTVSTDYASHSSKPKAYLNWVLLDEQFKVVTASCGFQQVGADTIFTTHTLTGQVMSKSGWLFVYVSNETPNVNVYFDNLQLTQRRGRMMEETHYYPFGLTMSGVSYQAGGKVENKYRYNSGSELQNKEWRDGSGLELYDTYFRKLDPQLGRWWQIDPKPNFSLSPYLAMGNNPLSMNDPLGDTIRISWYEHGKEQQLLWSDGALKNLDGGSYKGKVKGFLEGTVKALDEISSVYDGNKVLSTLSDSKHNFTLKSVDESPKKDVDGKGRTMFVPGNHDAAFGLAQASSGASNAPLFGTGGTIYFDPDGYSGSVITTNGEDNNATTNLAHELFHGYEANVGMESNDDVLGKGLGRNEYRAAFFENNIREGLQSSLRSVYRLGTSIGDIQVSLLDRSGCPVYVPPVTISEKVKVNNVNLIY